VELNTKRLILRDFVSEDAERLAECRTDERYWRYYDRPADVAAQAREHVEMFVAWQKAQPRAHFQLAITLKTTGMLIGDCGLRVRDQVSYGAEASEADIGYELDPAYWGNGYATEAARRIVDFGFRELGLRRVWTYCVADNAESWRVMERLGMRREGRLESNVSLDGRMADTLLYAILAEEWELRRD
jgi:ribosomal-protein-alanine N-acetyltransferase